MSTDPRDLVIDILRRMQGDLAELKEGQRAANRLFAAIEHHMAGFNLTVAAHSDELTDLKARVERIERRLELADPA
jgi:predicted  nucleic acid-binding Zn-ribbon protein